MKKEIEIPEGYDARIEGNKIIIEPKESKDERIRKMILEQMERWKKCAEDNNVEQDVSDASDAIAYLEKHKEQNLVEWSEEDEKKLRSVISLMRLSPSVVPLYDKMCLEGWLELLPERFSLQSNKKEEIVLHWENGHPEPYKSVLILRRGNVVVEGEWSEETGRWYQYGLQFYLEDSEVDGWMDKKSLLFGNFNTQSHWKPSKYQMNALKDVIEHALLTCRQQVPLESLYNDLQKLFKEI